MLVTSAVLIQIRARVSAVASRRRDAARPGLRAGPTALGAGGPRAEIRHHTMLGARVGVARPLLVQVGTRVAAGRGMCDNGPGARLGAARDRQAAAFLAGLTGGARVRARRPGAEGRNDTMAGARVCVARPLLV